MKPKFQMNQKVQAKVRDAWLPGKIIQMPTKPSGNTFLYGFLNENGYAYEVEEGSIKEA